MLRIAVLMMVSAMPATASPSDNCDMLRELQGDYFSLMNGIVQIGGAYQNAARDQLAKGEITEEQAGALDRLIVSPPLRLGGSALRLSDIWQDRIEARCD